MIFEGAISVKAIIEGKQRIVECVFIDENKDDRNTRYLKQLVAKYNIDLKLVKREVIDEMCQGKTHGGICAMASSRKYADPFQKKLKNNFITIIEGVEDPFNLGYILRTLYAAGCDLVITKTRDLSHCESVILKSSSGASDKILWATSDDLENIFKYYKAKGYKVYAAARNDAQSLFDVTFNDKKIVCIGGEMRGLSRVVMDNSDQNVYIPYANDFKNALNASSATAVIAYEVFRQSQK